MMDIPALKQALRREVVARVLAMKPDRRREQEAGLLGLFPTLPGYGEAETVLLFASAFPEEYDTAPFLRHAFGQGKQVICPRVDRAADRLRLHRVADPTTDFRAGMLGIPEPRRRCPEVAPSAIDWVLVPGLAFDASGYRLGRGRGHYDRLLPTLRPEAGRWALALDPQWVEALPIEAHDQPLDGVVGVDRRVVTPRSDPEKFSGL